MSLKRTKFWIDEDEVTTLNQEGIVEQTDLQFVKKSLSELGFDGGTPDEQYLTTLVLASALVCGPETAPLAELTQLPADFVEAIRQRMIQAGLWTEIDVMCDHWFGEGNVASITAICLDVMIAQGLLVRKWNEPMGDYEYCSVGCALTGNEHQQKVN